MQNTAQLCTEKGTAGPAGRLTKPRVDLAFQIWSRDRSIQRVAEALEIAWETAKKLIENGLSNPPLPSFESRLALEIRSNSAQLADLDPVKVLLENVQIMSEAKRMLQESLKIPGASPLDRIKIVKELGDVVTQESRLLLQAREAGLGSGNLEDRIAALPDADIEALALSGIVPESLLDVVPFAAGCDFDRPTRPMRQRDQADARPETAPTRDAIPDIDIDDPDLAPLLSSMRSDLAAIPDVDAD